jgi:transposase
LGETIKLIQNGAQRIKMTKTPKFTREEFEKIYDAGKEAIYAFILSLLTRIEALEQRLGMNSTNNSKTPSSDGLSKPKPKSRREKTGRKPGGQEGHAGTTLAPKENPDIVIEHEPQQCSCGCDLSEVSGTVVQKRQVADLPKIELEYTEHHVIEKECPDCHQKSHGELPNWIEDTAVQYGPQVRALLVYLNTAQYLPYERICELCETLFGFAPSEGTIYNALENCYEELESFEEEIKAKLQEAEVLHCDETGCRVKGKTQWMHVGATETETYYHVDEKRGKEALDRMDLLEGHKGTVVHDCLPTYFQYDVSHGICNAHILRELKYVSEEMGQSWAEEMSEHLKSGLNSKEEKGIPDEREYEEYVKKYLEILEIGNEQQPPPPPRPEGKRGREAKSKSQNLIDRLERHRESVLAFLRKEEVPFTNNRAEQDIRMIKVKVKVSGGFRSPKGAQIFARIRGAFSTFKKRGLKLFDELKAICFNHSTQSVNS